MTQKEFEIRLYQAIKKAYQVVLSQTPVRSGILISSIDLKATPTGYVIKVNTDQAPHMVYTEEEWKSDRWGGRDNPNEGWFKLATELAFRTLRAELSSGRFIGNKE